MFKWAIQLNRALWVETNKEFQKNYRDIMGNTGKFNLLVKFNLYTKNFVKPSAKLS